MNKFKKEEFNLKFTENAKKTCNKILACTLATLTFVSPATQVVQAGTVNEPLPAGSVVREDVEHPKHVIKTPKKSFWERHKDKILLGGMGALALMNFYLLRNRQNQPINPVNPINPPIQVPNQNQNQNQPQGGQAGPLPNLPYNRYNEDNGYMDEARIRVMQGWNRGIHNFMENHTILKYGVLIPAAVAFFVDKIGSFAKQFNHITGSFYSIERIKEGIESWIKRKKNSINNKPVELRESIDNIDNLFNEIKGQEEAKKEVRSIVFGILHRKKNAELSGKKYARGDVLYFYGPSRVGKSLMAEGLARHKILSSITEPYYISASEIDKDSRKETILDQLFGMSSYGGYGGYGDYDDYGGRGSSALKKPKNLVKYISENPNGIIIIDEYDKMWSPALDEVFRTIVDKGTVNVKGQTIDCSGMTFILTSNESNASIRGGNQYSGNDIDDGTGSRTFIKHDKSFLNRIRPVEFKNLDAAAYEEILRKEMKTDIIDYWANPEVAGLDIVITDEAMRDMAKAVEKKNEGASHVQTLIQNLLLDITRKVLEGENKQKDYYRNKKMYVNFNLKKGTFVLTEEEKSSVDDNNIAVEEKNEENPDKKEKTNEKDEEKNVEASEPEKQADKSEKSLNEDNNEQNNEKNPYNEMPSNFDFDEKEFKFAEEPKLPKSDKKESKESNGEKPSEKNQKAGKKNNDEKIVPANKEAQNGDKAAKDKKAQQSSKANKQTAKKAPKKVKVSAAA